MGAFDVAFEVQGLAKVESLARTLREFDRAAAQERLNKRIEEKAPELVSALQSAARAIPAAGRDARRDGQSLRAALSSAIRLEKTPEGVRVIVDSGQMPDGAKQMGYAFDRADGWDHPVFGTSARVRQSGSPWFRKTVAAHARQFDAAGQTAIEDIAQGLGLRR